MATKEYAGGAAPTYLVATINGSATAFTLNDATNWPTGATGPFWVKLSAGLPNEEKIKCSSRSGNNFTVASGGRGGDGTSAQTHTGGVACIAEHIWTAEDAREANTHINDDTNDDHSQYFNATRHNIPTAHPMTALPMAAAGTDLGDTIVGADATLARGGHKHGFPALTAYTPTWTGSGSNPTGVTGFDCWFGRFGKLGYVEFNLAVTALTSAGSGDYTFSLPPGWTAAHGARWPAFVDYPGAAPVPGIALVSGTTLAFYAIDDSPATTSYVQISAAYPATAGLGLTIWASGWVSLT